ncbi:MAG: 4Fe-4S binding protein [Saccharofermentanales bacterium]
MLISILSGKGGTGKTLVSVNMAVVSECGTYADCDVEEPNGYLFLNPVISHEEEVNVKIPVIDADLCDGCRKCIDFCNFNALAYTGNKVIVFEDICHSCGGCTLVCPRKAITEKDKSVGKFEKGMSGNTTFMSGTMKVGVASGIPIVKRILKEVHVNREEDVFIDSPPGSACIVMESIRYADYCVLVAEPTIFGRHNLEMVHELVKVFGKKYGVVLNKCTDKPNPSEDYCLKEGISILGRIPFDASLGAIASVGGIAALEDERFRAIFNSILSGIKEDPELI